MMSDNRLSPKGYSLAPQASSTTVVPVDDADRAEFVVSHLHMNGHCSAPPAHSVLDPLHDHGGAESTLWTRVTGAAASCRTPKR